MGYDFFKEKYKNPEIYNWNQYTIVKCTELRDTTHYPKSIRQYYKNKQIARYWEFSKFFTPKKTDIPEISFLFRVAFSLKKPFISAGDEQFWPNMENPICKEKVLKIPMARASSLKGSLRSVVRDRIGNKEQIVERLFGNTKEAKEAKKGRLKFYPIFFRDIGLEVIAPHDRETKVAKENISPIHIEKVPIGTEAEFYLLYYPFDLLGDKVDMETQREEDLKVLSQAIYKMFTKYGFGAKTAEGYGITEETMEVNGRKVTSIQEFEEVVLSA